MNRRLCALPLCLFALLLLFAGWPMAASAQVPAPCPAPVLDSPADSKSATDLGEGSLPAPDLAASFVTTYGGRFWVDGHSFRHVGVNGGFYQADDVWNDTWYLRQGGVKQVRIILANTAYPNVEDVISRLNAALDASWNRGIRITVALTNFYYGDHWGHDAGGGHTAVPGDEHFYDNCYEGHNLLDYDWIAGGFRQNYKPFVQTIVDRFKNDGRIFAWEIGNEIGVPPKPDGQPAIEETITFYREMAQFIKTVDGHHHLVAPGVICTRWLSLNDTQKYRFYELMDYVTEHHYIPRNNEGSLADDVLAAAYNKPLVIEEFGVSQWDEPYSLDHDLIMPAVSDFFDWGYAGEPVKTVDSLMVWGVDYGYDLGNDDHQFGPGHQNLANEYLQLWRETADWLRLSPRYSDVPPNSTFYSYIECLSNRRAVSGLASWVDDNHNDEFRPGDAITRAQAVKAIVRAMGFQLVFPAVPKFTDVPRSSIYYRYIETAFANGILNGYSDGTFHPDANLTRGQMSKVIVNAGIAKYHWQINVTGGPHFIDVPVGHTFYPYIETAYNRGIVGGYSNHYFYPDNLTTRGQLTKMLGEAVGCNALAD